MVNYFKLFSENVEGFKVRRNGQGTGCCPFHTDEDPSFCGNINKGLWICQACGRSGNAFQFCKRLGIDPRHYEGGNSELKYERGGSMNSKINESTGTNKYQESNDGEPSELSQDWKDKALVYHKYLLDNYDRLCNGLPWKKDIVEKLLVGYDVTAQRFTYPHFDEKGEIINIKWHKRKDSKPYSVEGRGENRLYPLHLLKEYSKSEILIFCEGEKDVVTLLSLGFNAVTNTTGAGSIPEDLSPLKNFENIIITLDKDKAGRKGAIKLATELGKEF